MQSLSPAVGRKISVVSIRPLSKKGSRAPVVYRNDTNFPACVCILMCVYSLHDKITAEGNAIQPLFGKLTAGGNVTQPLPCKFTAGGHVSKSIQNYRNIPLTKKTREYSQPYKFTAGGNARQPLPCKFTAGGHA